LNHTPNASLPDLNALICTARVCAGIGRFLLTLIAVSLITMPLTQYIWTWDHFLQGGQDFEFGVLTTLIALCLVLLLAHYFKQSVALLLAACNLFLYIFYDRALGISTRGKTISAFRCEQLPSSILDIYNLPLRV
jgi:hypothetical protein